MSLIVGLPVAGLTLAALAPTGAVGWGRTAYVCGWVLVVLLLSLAGQLWVACRGTMPFALITPDVGPALTAIWYAVPLLVVAGAAGVATDRAAHGLAWWPVLSVLLVTVAILLWGLRALDRQISAHRS